jgi:two-component system, chemotaxis family, chemotaxis protein CheY
MKKILVIEDDVALLWLINRIVSNKYEVTKVRSGREALQALQNGYMPDLIISDLGLPIIDGMDLLQHLKKSGLFYHIPVIILSGNQNPQVISRCLSLGAAKFILKPFDPMQLVSEVNEVIMASEVNASMREPVMDDLSLVA